LLKTSAESPFPAPATDEIRTPLSMEIPSSIFHTDSNGFFTVARRRGDEDAEKNGFPSCRRTPSFGNDSILLDSGVRRNDGSEQSGKGKTMCKSILSVSL
jgi:hypothetical protein